MFATKLPHPYINKYTATNPNIPGEPRHVTNIMVIILIGIKIFTPDRIKFRPYNITKAKHNLLSIFKILFFIFITVNYMFLKILYSDIFLRSSKAFSKVTLSK